MMDLHIIDRRFRERIVEPLKRHLIQMTPPDYSQLYQAALPLGQDVLKVGGTMKVELTRLNANQAPSNLKAKDNAPYHQFQVLQAASWPISLMSVSNQHRTAADDLEMQVVR